MIKKLKNKKYKIFFLILYILLFIPNCFSIYYSVPASDDFAMTLGRSNYSNIFAEFFSAVQYFWTERGGTIFGFIIELIINPLNAHIHLGHIYGIYMIIAFLICMFCILLGVNRIIKYVFSVENDSFISAVITFMIAVMLIENYYYVEAYNWYVGMIAYPFVIAIMFLNFYFTLEFSTNGKKKNFIAMLITGIVVANTTAFDIPLGIFYLYIVLIKKGFNNRIDNIIKRYIPLIVYIFVGLITVIAPGNFARQSQYTEAVSLGTSIRQTVADVQFFGMAIIKERPVTLVIAAILVILGFAIQSGKSKKPGNIVLYAVASVCVWLGCLLPYVYGRGMTRTYLDVRMQYVFDFLFEISLCIGCVMLGQWIGYFVKTNLEKVGYILAAVMTVLGVAAVFVTGRYATTVSYEIYAKRAEIVASYDMWNGILLEIENSPNDDVVVDRDYNVPWNKYFLYSGMEPGEVYAVDLDAFYDSQQILPNVYYKKNSITINYPR